MKKLILILWLASFALFVQGAVKYWDINGATSGAGGPTPSGTWSASAANWSTDSTGSSATTTIATDGSDSAIFSAGSDATGTYTISVPSGVTVGGIVVKNGTVQKASGSAAVTLGTGSITVSNGAVFSIDGSAAIAASSGA